MTNPWILLRCDIARSPSWHLYWTKTTTVLPVREFRTRLRDYTLDVDYIAERIIHRCHNPLKLYSPCIKNSRALFRANWSNVSDSHNPARQVRRNSCASAVRNNCNSVVDDCVRQSFKHGQLVRLSVRRRPQENTSLIECAKIRQRAPRRAGDHTVRVLCTAA